MEFYQPVEDPPSEYQDLDDRSGQEYHSGSLFTTITDLLGSYYVDFNWRPWQVTAIKKSLNLLQQDNNPSPGILIEASVGSGKTLVATTLMFSRVLGRTGYKSKVIFLSPLVTLVQEQHRFFSSLCDGWNDLSAFNRRLKVAYRCGSETQTDIRSSQIICATYEHGRTLLSNGDLQIYPTSARLRRTWAGSIELVVIDEVHNLMSDRGPILTAIFGFCRYYGIPLMVMTGTSHRKLRDCLNQFFRPSFLVLGNENDSLCTQIPIRIDDQGQFITAMCGLVINSLVSETRSDGVLIFCPNIKEMRPLMDSVLQTLMEWKPRANQVENPQRCAALINFYAQLERGMDDDISELIDVQWSGYCPPDKVGREGECLANERRLCWMLAQVGIFYYWRNIGESYTRVFLDQLHRRRVRVIFSTSTLSAGVNLPGIRHVFITNQVEDMAQLGQMIGRCGRESEGFAFLYCQSPPTTDQVYQSLPKPIIGTRIHLMTWFIIKKAVSIRQEGEFLEGLWSLTVDQWKDFLTGLPFPNVGSDPLKDFGDVINKLVEVLGLAEISPEGILMSKVTPSLYRVSQEDPELLPIIFLCCASAKEIGVMSYTFCPLLISALYWLSQRRRLPRIILPSGGVEEIIAPFIDTPFPMPVDEAFRAIHDILKTLTRQSGILSWMREWQKKHLTIIIVLTCYILVGFAPPWHKHIPRSPFCEHISGMGLYTTVVSDAMMFLGRPPKNLDAYVSLHDGLLTQAMNIIDEIRDPDFIQDQLLANPLTRYVISRSWLSHPSIDMWLTAFARSYPVNTSQVDWLSKTREDGVIFGNRWLEAVLPLSPEDRGVLDLNPMEHNSD